MTCRLNRSSGSRSSLLVQEETCWGTAATSGQNALGIEFASTDLANAIADVQSQLIRPDRMRPAPQQGNHAPGGNITGELQPHGVWPLMLRHALGGAVATTGSSPYVHTFAGAVDLPEGLTVEERYGFPDDTNTYRWIRWLGGHVNEFQMQIQQGGIISARAGLLFKSEDITPVADLDATPTYPTDNDPFNAFQASLLMDQNADGTRTAIATINSLDLLINNGIDPDQYAIDGTSNRADLPEDLRTINGNMDAFFTYDNWQLYQAFRNNSTLSMEITLTRGTYSWHFTIPAFKVRGNPTPAISGRGPLNIPMTWEGFRDEVSGQDITVTITNTDPAITTAA